MKSETRANLIFITIFLGLSLPGLVIMLTRSIRTSGLAVPPPPVRGVFAYMDPTPQFEGLPRVTPPAAARFVHRVVNRLTTMQPGLRSVLEDATNAPIMSRRLSLQLIALGAHENTYRVAVIGWHPRFNPLPALYQFTGQRGATSVAGVLGQYEQQNLSLEVRSELRDYGYIIPPESVMWMIVSFPGAEPVDAMTLRYRFDQTVVDDELKIASASVRTPATRPATEQDQ